MSVPGDSLLSPLDRVRASRERLRLAMSPPPPRPATSADAASWAARWKDKILHVPVVGAVLESVQAWWTSHPIRPMAQVATEAANAAVQPVARHHPLVLMLAAFGLGAGLFWAKPWKLVLRSALFAGLIPQLATRALGRMPIDAWLAMLNSTLLRRPDSKKPPPFDAQGQTAPG